jgi:phosphodiesterase/alkaline phosphatase D-like protein
MKIVVYPRVSKNSRTLLVWIGVLQRQPPAPTLNWTLQGDPVQPTALRVIQSARTDRMLGADKNIARAFTGLYEFSQLASGAALQPDTPYTIAVKAEQEVATLETRTLPARVTSDLTDSFNVLLVSCFHRDTDPGGYAGILINDIKQRHSPDITLLLGDQVYLDLPTLMDFEDKLPWLAEKFEQDYLNNWQGPEGYSRVLASAPSASMADDHEYWNNYPHRSYHLQNTYTESGRRNWEEAARRMYEAFQLTTPAADMGRAITFDVPPLSFFLADMRTYRDYDLKRVMSEGDPHNANLPNARQELADWVQHVIDNKMFAVFASGQSLFANQPQSLWGKVKLKVKGTVADHELFEYGDFGYIVQQLERLSDEGRPLLCLTGDVHYGRVLAAKDLRKNWRVSMYEIISSPASLVMDVTSDWKEKKATAEDPWPRHSEAPDPDLFYAQEALGQRFVCEPKSVLHRQKGNHVVLLNFRDVGGVLELKVKYWPIYPNKMYSNPNDLKDAIYLSTLG